jgi:hypothetical protein
MESSDDPRHALLLAALRGQGPLPAASLAARLGVSQPTLSRLLQGLSAEVKVAGSGKKTRYAAAQTILGQAAGQPLHWVHEDGRVEAWGRLTLLARGQVHVQAFGIDDLFTGLPWFLTPLRAQGFLGRLLARQLAPLGFDADPERWPLEQVLHAALALADAPGALRLGPADEAPAPLPVIDTPASFDALADEVAQTLPAGSSAGGEQAKFLARTAGGEAVLVKFSPPRGTPFGERWHDLLLAEHLALETLAAHGTPVAASRLVQTARRSYLVSQRFDRIGPLGRRHVVALDAWHTAFVPGARQHWAATCAELARQRRVPAETPEQAQALLHFGRLIGNTDMHFGNLSLWLEPADVAAGRGRLAPVYDMLPMRWRPDATTGALDLTPFTPDAVSLQSAAAPLAAAFWARCAAEPSMSRPFAALAGAMARRINSGIGPGMA